MAKSTDPAGWQPIEVTIPDPEGWTPIEVVPVPPPGVPIEAPALTEPDAAPAHDAATPADKPIKKES